MNKALMLHLFPVLLVLLTLAAFPQQPKHESIIVVDFVRSSLDRTPIRSILRGRLVEKVSPKPVLINGKIGNDLRTVVSSKVMRAPALEGRR